MSKVDLSDLVDDLDLSDLANHDAPVRGSTREIRIGIIGFWVEITCKCGKHYSAPDYGVMAKYRVEVYRQFKWRFHAYHYVLIEEMREVYEPVEMEVKYRNIKWCPACLPKALPAPIYPPMEDANGSRHETAEHSQQGT